MAGAEQRSKQFQLHEEMLGRITALHKSSIARALTEPMGQQIGHGNSAFVTTLAYPTPEGHRLVVKRAKQNREAEMQKEIHRLRRLPTIPLFQTILHTEIGAAVMLTLYTVEEGIKQHLYRKKARAGSTTTLQTIPSTAEGDKDEAPGHCPPARIPFSAWNEDGTPVYLPNPLQAEEHQWYDKMDQRHMKELFDTIAEDMQCALSVLHQHGIIHADIHLGNIMSSQSISHTSPQWVLIDLGDNAAEALYSIQEGYGAQVRGGDLHRPPRVDKSQYHMGKGDLYRLSLTLSKQIFPLLLHYTTGPVATMGADIPTGAISSEIADDMRRWVTQAKAETPPAHPTSMWPSGSWLKSAKNLMLVLKVSLWDKDGNPVTSTLTIQPPMTDAERTPQECLRSNFYGNANGRMVEEAQSSKNKGTGSWERTAISARWTLMCDLKTTGKSYLKVNQTVYPYKMYGNSNGRLVLETGPPPATTASPVPSNTGGQKRVRDAPAQFDYEHLLMSRGQGIWADPPPPPADASASSPPAPGTPELELPPLPLLPTHTGSMMMSNADMVILSTWLAALPPEQRRILQWAVFAYSQVSR